MKISRKVTYNKFKDKKAVSGSTSGSGTELDGSARRTDYSRNRTNMTAALRERSANTSNSKIKSPKTLTGSNARESPHQVNDNYKHSDENVNNTNYEENKDGNSEGDSNEDEGDKYDLKDDMAYR
ncbi:hypothetical protein ElyMa_001926500 [Elysia marginata]|uniref:Uncharacterized protein n=1 Tax=Elysia marginata TaxID=1093978 RepID=A0AAV4EVF5_9GAST|nr:hypothetical protein ElyMa_001926500 [Elysia marginata]